MYIQSVGRPGEERGNKIYRSKMKVEAMIISISLFEQNEHAGKISNALAF